jgi:hypothetical protein
MAAQVFDSQWMVAHEVARPWLVHSELKIHIEIVISSCLFPSTTVLIAKICGFKSTQTLKALLFAMHQFKRTFLVVSVENRPTGFIDAKIVGRKERLTAENYRTTSRFIDQ